MATIGCGTTIGQGRYAILCGKSGGRKRYCPDCEARADKEYPQGWSYYAGDTCSHGVYVGGIGIDHMCFKCEMGED